MPEAILSRDAPYEKGRIALLLVDMQRVWLERKAGAAHGVLEPDEFYEVTRTVTIPNCERLLVAARSAGVEVLHTIIRSLTEDGRDRSLDHKMTPIHLAKSDPDALPVASVAPVGDEILIPKTSSGVFNSTNIDYLLRNLGARHLVICGIMTDQCVDMAVRDAADRGYMVTVAADACFAASRSRHEAALKAFGGYCWLTEAAIIVERFALLR